MVFAIFLIICLVYFLFSRINKKKEEAKIYYDLKTCRMLKNLSLACVIGDAGLMVLMRLVDGTVYRRYVEIVPILIMFLSMALVPIILLTVDSYVYIRTLKRYGYEVPENKKDYDGLVKNLSRDEKQYEAASCGAYSECFLAFSGFAFLIATATAVSAFVYIEKWYFYDFLFMTIVSVFFLSFWLFSGFLFRKQSDNAKYVDPIFDDDTKKSRMSFMDGLLYFLIFGLITLAGIYTTFSMTEYIFRSRVSADMQKLSICETVAQQVWDSYGTGEDLMKECPQTYAALLQGIDLMEVMQILDGEPMEQSAQSKQSTTTEAMINSILQESFLQEPFLQTLMADDCVQESLRSIKLQDTHYYLLLENGEISGKYENEHYEKKV